MDEDMKLSLFGDSKNSEDDHSRSNYDSKLGNDTNGVSYTTYLEKDKHFRKLNVEEISTLKQKYSANLMNPPTIIPEYPFLLKNNNQTSVDVPPNSTKPLVSPINHNEYFAVLDKINARVLQRGTTVTKIGVAVSGGGDSMGTAILVKKWADYLKQKKGIDMEVIALIVDHQIREESEHEMLYVHEVLTKTVGFKNAHCFQCLWPENQKKQQRISRLKRQLIMTSECISQNIDLLITGHHKQDNIETIIHRVAFSSGINGLNGIPLIYSYCVADATIMLARPGLVFDCNELKAVCAQFNIKWVEDPKNSDEREFRSIIRSRLGLLYQAGVSPGNFYNLLLTLGAIRHIMLRESLNFYNRYVRFDDELGFAGIYFYSLEKTAEFVASNALNSLIQYVTNREFPVALSSIKNVVRYLPSTKRSLGGCLLVPDKKVLYIIRDTGPLRRKKNHTTIRFTDKGIVWDNRFFIQIFQYNKMNIPEDNITYSKKLRLEKQPEYDNTLIPNFDGKVDTDPNGVYKIRPFTETDHKYFGEHYPLMMKAAKQYPNYLTRSFPVIEDSKGILGIPFLGWKRCANIFWYIKFLPSRQKFVPGEADSLYDFVKLFSNKNK